MAPVDQSRSFSVGLASLLSPDPDLISGCFAADFVPSSATHLKLSAAVAAAQLAFSAAAADAVGNRFSAKADAWSGAAVLPSDPFGSNSSSSSSGGCPLGFSNPAVYKQYPIVHVPSTLSLLTPKQLLWLFLKNSGIVLLLQTNGWLYQALEAEEAAVQQGTQAQLPPFPSVLQSLVKAAWQSWRELLTRITRSEIRHWVRSSASSRVAWKVLKDPRESITGKAVFYLNVPSVRLLPLYSTTMFRTQLPTYAAEFIVACAYDAIADLGQLIRAPQKQTPQLQQQQAGVLASLQSLQQQAAQRVQQLVSGQVSIDWVQLPPASKTLGIKAAKHLVRVSGTAVLAALGAGVAGAVAPREVAGVWAFRGLLVTDLIVANILGFLLDGPLAGAFGDAAAAEAAKQQHQQQQHLPPHAADDMVRLLNDLAR